MGRRALPLPPADQLLRPVQLLRHLQRLLRATAKDLPGEHRPDHPECKRGRLRGPDHLADHGQSSFGQARESAADAAHALHDAQNAQITALDGQSRLRRSVTELQSQAEVAGLRQQLAQQQLDALQQQLKSGNPNGPQMTPSDEQNARISEREKYLGVVDAGYQLRQAEIHLLRQTGQLIPWLKSATSSQAPSAPAPQP